MSEAGPPRDEAPDGADRERAWAVDEADSLARLRESGERAGGRLVYVDEHGRRRRLPADIGELTPAERRAAVAALSSALGAPDPDYARLAAVEYLTELRAAGTMGEVDYKRERRRLLGDG